jgi:hypothetical protein
MGRSDGLGTDAIQPKTEMSENVAQQQPVDFIRAADDESHGFQVGVAFPNLGGQPGSASHSINELNHRGHREELRISQSPLSFVSSSL